MYVIQASPLSKLFMRQYVDRCEEDPAFALGSTPFEVLIPRTAGAVILTHNVPVITAKLLPKAPNRVVDDNSASDELHSFVQWLTGGPEGDRSYETDTYGVVMLNLDLDVGASLFDIAKMAEVGTETAEKKAKKEFDDFKREMGKKSQEAMKQARELADARVYRAIKNTHRNLMKSYETLRTEGKGVYAPSVAEAVGAYIIKDEIKKSGKQAKAMIDMLTETMKNTTVLA